MGFSDIFILVFASHFGFTNADTCYKYSYTYWSIYSSYCSGYCTGSYGYETCNYYYYYYVYDYSLSYGAIVGIVIGCLVFFGVFITIIVAVCSACTKRAGQTGRMVYPSQGVSTIAYSNGYQSSNAYPPPTAPYQPPGYSQATHPPANYQATNKSNFVASVPPIEHQSHSYR